MTDSPTSDQQQLKSIVQDLYAAVSAPAGVAPPIESAARHLHPLARKCRTARDVDGEVMHQIMSGAEYADNVRDLVTSVGFFEVETGHEAFVYGDIAHVISHYDGFADAAHTRLVKRGVNSIQFLRVEGAWKVFNMIWDDEINRVMDEVPEPATGSEP